MIPSTATTADSVKVQPMIPSPATTADSAEVQSTIPITATTADSAEVQPMIPSPAITADSAELQPTVPITATTTDSAEVRPTISNTASTTDSAEVQHTIPNTEVWRLQAANATTAAVFDHEPASIVANPNSFSWAVAAAPKTTPAIKRMAASSQLAHPAILPSLERALTPMTKPKLIVLQDPQPPEGSHMATKAATSVDAAAAVAAIVTAPHRVPPRSSGIPTGNTATAVSSSKVKATHIPKPIRRAKGLHQITNLVPDGF